MGNVGEKIQRGDGQGVEWRGEDCIKFNVFVYLLPVDQFWHASSQWRCGPGGRGNNSWML